MLPLGRITIEDAVSVAIWGGLLIVALIAMTLGLAWIRRQTSRTGAKTEPTPWTLAGLRRLRAAGRLEEEEYVRMRQAMLDAFAKPPKDTPPPEAEPGESGEAPRPEAEGPTGSSADEQAGGPPAPSSGPSEDESKPRPSK